MPQELHAVRQSNTLVRKFYLLSVLTLALSGFGQMPIFKRYYVADIPGLGWLAQFYVTHLIHYIAATMFLGIVAYWIVDYIGGRDRRIRISPSGYVRSFLLGGILISGVLLVIRNLAGSNFSPATIIALDLCHLGLVLGFLTVALYSAVGKKGWTISRQQRKK